jgi:hypothetical protein
MKRALVAGFAACVGAYAVLAASPEVESAIKAFKAVGADAGKLSAFCAMTKAMDSMGEKEDPAADAKIGEYMKQLGPNFEAAWKTADTVEESTEDGKALGEAIDEIAGKCPQ